MKKQIFILTMLLLTFVAVYKVNAQNNWLTAGNPNATIVSTTYGTLGTTSTRDIAIIAKNHQVGYIGSGSTTAATLGDFDIGVGGSFPQNKLLVENNQIYITAGTYSPPYNALQNIYTNFTYFPGPPPPATGCIDPAEIGIFSASNQAANNCGNNQGIIGLADEDGLAINDGFNVGVSGIANGAKSFNLGGFFYAYGADISNSATNTGVSGFAEGAGTLFSNGGHFAASGGFTNSGVSGSVFGTAGTTANYGVVGKLSGLSNPGSSNTVPYYSIYALTPSGSSSTDDCYAAYLDGDVYCTGSYLPSDAKLKENIVEYTGALDKLNQLNVKSYTFKQKDFPAMSLPKGQQVGVMAEDLKNVFPNLVKQSTQPAITDEKTKKVRFEAVNFDAVNYQALIPVLVQGVKEVDAKTAPIAPLAATVAQQQAQIEQLLTQLNSQNTQLNDLRSLVDDICNVGCAGLQQGSSTPPVTPQDVALYQSIPNPTSGVATIGYLINIPFTTASINVTALNGSAIQQFKITQQGKGSVVFDGSRYAGGTFNYTLYVDDKPYDTKTIVMVKN